MMMYQRRRILAPRNGARGSGSLPEFMTDVTVNSESVFRSYQGYSFQPSKLVGQHLVIVIVFKVSGFSVRTNLS